MKTAAQMSLLSMLSALSAAAAGEDAAMTAGGQAAVDTSKWECSLCRFEDGLSGTLQLGAGNVSDSSSKFGEYNGLDENGVFVIGGGAASYRGADAAYWDLSASDLGLDTRSLAAKGGHQGRFSLFLDYDEIPHIISDSAQTPFVGNGGASLTLPGGFPAGTTGLMPLAGTLRPVGLETKRKQLGVGASWTPARAWSYEGSLRRQTRDGTQRTSRAFFVNASQLVAPVDYVTDQIDASASYAGARLQAKFAYYGSMFRDSNSALTWQNPFAVPGFPGAVAGQLALPPDSQFHQISASAGYQFTDRARATANVAFGRMTQDDAFLASTLNATLVVPALPRASLDGRVDILNASIQLSSAVTDRLRLQAELTRDDQDNRTPRAAYQQVATDMFLGSPTTNLPYGFTRDRLKLRVDYKAWAGTKASVGFDHDTNERSFQEVDTTYEHTIWGKITSRFLDRVDMTLKLARGDRDNSGYSANAAIVPPENPLLRKYNLADRRRDNAEVRADVAATENISIGLQIDASNDEYSDSTVGLTSGRERNFGGDVTVMLSERTNLHLFGNRQVIESEQAGSQAFATADWFGENKDTIKFAGIGIRHAAFDGKLDIGADYTVTRSRSAIGVNAGTTAPGFPDLSASRDALTFHATYRLKDDLSLRAGYWYESYDSESWMLAGVAPDTIPNVLAFGEQSPRYRVHAAAVSVRYKF